jgi:putative membrane protein
MLSMSSLDDPRVFWAAERTLLAWVRTSLAAMGLGLVTAKFGIFLRFITHDAAPEARQGSTLAVGVAITLLGAVLCLIAAIQFRRFTATLGANELPPRQLIGIPSLAAFAFALIGLVMAACLLF